jgi:hypothetical protein
MATYPPHRVASATLPMLQPLWCRPGCADEDQWPPVGDAQTVSQKERRARTRGLAPALPGYPEPMTKFNFTPLLVAGAVASAVTAGTFVASDPTPSASGHPVVLATYQLAPAPADPGGGGCINGNCGSGGANSGPGGGAGGVGCIPTASGTACGSGGANAGPGGLPGGTGCLPGVGCGSGHG